MACLHAIACQNLARNLFEVILVLDGLEIPSRTIADFGSDVSLRVFGFRDRLGRSAARNVGLISALGTIGVSIDCDMVSCPNLLSSYLTAHQSAAVVCIGTRRFVRACSKMEASITQDFSDIFGRCLVREDYRSGFYRATNNLKVAAEPFWAFSTCNCSFPLDLALRVGLFDENMQGWGLEDIEFGYRLWKTGTVTFRRLDSALALHVEHERDKAEELQSWSINRAYCVRKHGEIFDDPPSRRKFPLLLPVQN